MNNTETKYMQVVSQIKIQIEDGTLVQGQKIYSEHQLCKQWGVSRQTIRKALSVLEENKYIERRQGSGTYVLNAQPSSQKKIMTVGLLSSYLDSYIFPEQTAGIEQALSAKGYSLQLGIHNNRFENEAQALKSMLSLGVDGLLAEPAKTALDCLNDELYQEFISRNIPVVLMNTSHKNSTFPLVSLEDRKGGQILANHAIAKGHTKIAGIFKSDDYQGQLRLMGFLDAMKKHKLMRNERRVFVYSSELFPKLFHGYYEEMVLDIIGDSTAVVCYNDEIAEALLDLFNRRGIKVPKEISILGYDNSDKSRLAIPQMTTMNHPSRLIGEKAAKKLIALMSGEKDNSSYFFSPELIERNSLLDLSKESSLLNSNQEPLIKLTT